MLDYRSYGDVVNDYLANMAFTCMPYRYERGEFIFECSQGQLFATSTEWGWYPYHGEKTEYAKFDIFGVQELIGWLERIESWL